MGSFRPFTLGLLVLGFVVAFSEGDTFLRVSSTPTDKHGKYAGAVSGPAQAKQVSGDTVQPSVDLESQVDDDKQDHDDEKADPPLVAVLQRTRRVDRAARSRGSRSGKGGSHRGKKGGGYRGGKGGAKKGGKSGRHKGGKGGSRWSRKDNSHRRGKGGRHKSGKAGGNHAGNKWHGGNGSRHR